MQREIRMEARAKALWAVLLVASPAACTISETSPAVVHPYVDTANTPATTPLVPVLLADVALEVLALDDAARARVESIVVEMSDGTAEVRAARSDLLFTLADGVDAGRIDDAASRAAILRIDRAVYGSSFGLERGAVRLFRVLGPSQRKEIADVLSTRWSEWQARWGSLDVAEQANAWGPTGAVRELRDRLGLDATQVQSIRERLASAAPSTIVPPREERRAAYARFLDAFRGNDEDDLVAATVPSTAIAARGSAGHVVALASAVLAVATPEQRVTFSAFLREHAR